MTRSLLRVVARCMAAVMLLAQLSVAAYACPLQSPASSQPVQQVLVSADAQGMPAAAMSNCDDMGGPTDKAFSNLCAEHCKYGQQSYHAPTLNAPAAVFNALYVTPTVPERASLPRPTADATSALVAASPPLAIQHCCFRI